MFKAVLVRKNVDALIPAKGGNACSVRGEQWRRTAD